MDGFVFCLFVVFPKQNVSISFKSYTRPSDGTDTQSCTDTAKTIFYPKFLVLATTIILLYNNHGSSNSTYNCYITLTAKNMSYIDIVY
jgi:hypothetical protein